jgi:hypothetical protein
MKSFRIPLGLIIIGTTFLALLAPAEPSKNSPPTANAPLSIVASIDGRFGQGRPWHLTVDTNRQAHLTVETYPKATTRQFVITTNQLHQLARVLEQERFFALKSDYGQRVPDGSTKTITIARAGITNTVNIHYLMNWVHSDTAKLKEPARAVRVFQEVRSWFNDKEAVELKKYEDMVLEAAR